MRFFLLRFSDRSRKKVSRHSKARFFTFSFSSFSFSFFVLRNDGDNARLGVDAVVVDSNSASSSADSSVEACRKRGVLHFGTDAAVDSSSSEPTSTQFVVGLVPRCRPLHSR